MSLRGIFEGNFGTRRQNGHYQTVTLQYYEDDDVDLTKYQVNFRDSKGLELPQVIFRDSKEE